MQKRIRDFYIQFWLRQAEEANEAGLLKELPHTLRTEALWSMSRKYARTQPRVSSFCAFRTETRVLQLTTAPRFCESEACVET